MTFQAFLFIFSLFFKSFTIFHKRCVFFVLILICFFFDRQILCFFDLGFVFFLLLQIPVGFH